MKLIDFIKCSSSDKLFFLGDLIDRGERRRELDALAAKGLGAHVAARMLAREGADLVDDLRGHTVLDPQRKNAGAAL